MKGRLWKERLLREMRNAERQLELARARPARRTPIEPVHEARKSIKILRAALRLLRGTLPAPATERLKISLRAAAHAVGPLRDLETLRQTLARIALATASPAPTLPRRNPNASIPGALRLLRKAERELEGLPWSEIDGRRVKKGLKRLYRKGRRAAAEAEAKETDEALHAWRKRVKDLGYALRLMDIGQPSFEAKLHRLAEHLGDDHDLALFQQRFPDRSRHRPFQRHAAAARRRHRKKAFRIARRLFAERPEEFLRRMAPL